MKWKKTHMHKIWQILKHFTKSFNEIILKCLYVCLPLTMLPISGFAFNEKFQWYALEFVKFYVYKNSNVAFLLVRQKFRRILVPTFSFFLLPFFILSSGNVFLTLFVSEFNVKVLVIFSNLVQRSNFQFSTKVLLIIFSNLGQRSYE